MEGVPYDLSGYLSSEGLSDVMPAGSGLHDDRAGQAGQFYFGSRSGLPVTNSDFSWNYSASRMIRAGDTPECPSTPMHAWHDSQFASHYETYDADQSQGYNITPGLHSEYAEDLAQVAPDVETIANEDHNRTHSRASTFEPSEAGIDTVASQQVLGSTISQTETDQDVSMIGPDELKVLLPEQTCHCATCIDGYYMKYWLSDSKLSEHGVPALIGRTLSCRITGCQWTSAHSFERTTNIERLLDHERWDKREEHYGKPGEWKCREIGCKFVTKRWTDFERHASTQHCIKPKDLKCPVLSCKYHLINFSRKDKLKSHVEKVHKGSPHPAEPNQAIKPKVEDQV